ncbi:hypothetical protein H5410_050076 [Solanum commersonii]|uniref:Uncharacterized protein n=1 Tax=Solanum commersonii TaxID=4109 RepID=A0A9J5WUG4_SOLCO|nr:hypothetical protein H5410_050076 [Solanum commersonii]
MIEINQECTGIARTVEAQISKEYEICFEKTQEIESLSNNPRLSLEYERNSIKKKRVFNGTEWEKKVLLQTSVTANHTSNYSSVPNIFHNSNLTLKSDFAYKRADVFPSRIVKLSHPISNKSKQFTT